jgi:hypothetical protein
MNLDEKVVVLTTLPNMVPVGAMIKEKISSLYAADVAERTLRDELLEKGLIKKIEQVVVETATEEVEEVEEVKEVVTPTLHDLNLQILELEGIERSFNTIEYMEKLTEKRLDESGARINSGDELLMAHEIVLINIAKEKTAGKDLQEIKGEIRGLRLQKRAMLEAIAINEAQQTANKKAAAKDEVVVKQVIKEIITEDVAEATEMEESIIHKVLVKITRQRSAAKARAALAAKRAQVKAKAQATNVFALLGLNLEVLTDVVELMNRTNTSMKEAWTWFHRYASAPEVNYGRRFI